MKRGGPKQSNQNYFESSWIASAQGLAMTDLFFLLVFDFLVLAFHAVLEALDAFAQTAHQLRDLCTAEQQEHDQGDDEQFLGADK